MNASARHGWNAQEARNEALLASTKYMRDRVESQVVPLHVDIESSEELSPEQVLAIEAMEIEAARTAIRALGELARIKEVDHLGGGLGIIPPLLLSLAVVDYESKHFTIEHAHTSIGYYSLLSIFGFLDPEWVVQTFRRGLDIPGHVSWVPGGTQLNGGRLGVMIPTAVGQALGVRARHGERAWVLCHCGDAGWISGQALNGFNGADLHGAPVTFVMDRNGIQLSGSNRQIMDKDPRGIIEAMGITILEVPTVQEARTLYAAYREAYALARQGRPSLIYPVGLRSSDGTRVDLQSFGERFGIEAEVQAYAAEHQVALDTEVWVPGSLMSYRDVEAMLDCLFLVNQLPGGKGHHDGHLKGRDVGQVLGGAMLQVREDQAAALAALRAREARRVVTTARPAPGTANLVLPPEVLEKVKLPGAGERVSARAGSQEGYAAVAQQHPDDVFVISCDLDPSTKLAKAVSLIPAGHHFEMSIEEQVSAMMANGLAMSSAQPRLVVFSTFMAFFEGIAREGMEMWRYQRNLNGVNEGLNVTFHMSHVGACTGRDHFSGWGLDWIALGLGYLPYLHRFYTPADARAAFVAVRDLAAHYGGHLIGIPRDNLPVLARQGSSEPLWEADSEWTALTTLRQYDGARKAVLAVGATAFLAGEAAEALEQAGEPVDAHVVNGFPLPSGAMDRMLERYPAGIVTIEDGIIGQAETGLSGFAGLVRGVAHGSGVPLAHLGIVDPRIAPSDGHMEVWAHFGLTAEGIVKAVQAL